MLLSIVSSLLLTAVPEGTHLTVSLEGAGADSLRRFVWVHEPSTAAFPRVTPGFGGGLCVEVGLRLPEVQWFTFSLGVRTQFGGWRGERMGDTASFWDVGLRSRFEVLLGPISLWGGIGTSLGNVVARTGGVDREVLVQAYDLSGGLRMRLVGPVGLGLFLELQHASSFARPEEEFSTPRFGFELTLTFDLASRRESHP